MVMDSKRSDVLVIEWAERQREGGLGPQIVLTVLTLVLKASGASIAASAS